LTDDLSRLTVEVHCYIWQVIADNNGMIYQMSRYTNIRFVEYLDRLLNKPQRVDINMPGRRVNGFVFLVHAYDEQNALKQANLVLDEVIEERKHKVIGISVK
jgi:hypothetical protein